MIKIPTPELISISDVKIHTKNVKKHPEKQISNLMQLIEWIGFKDPIVLDKNNNCKAGHGRLIAAKKLGMEEVSYVRVEGLTKKQMDLFIYMDNHVNESLWIKENVKLLLQEIPMKDLEIFDVEWERIVPSKFEEAEPLPEIPETPKTKLGDIYELGKHRVLCGDCTKDKAKLLHDVKIDLLLTDPPYGVDYASKNKFLNNLGKGNHIQKDIINDDISDYGEFFSNFLENIQFSEYSAFYITISGAKLYELTQALLDNDYKISQHLVWVKNGHVLGRQDYASRHEFILYGWKNKHKFFGNFQTTVWEIDKPLKNELHPTMKPLELMQKPIINSTQKGMIVYDPFLGSGSTLIACEQTDRVCYGMELDPSYVDVIVQRWENFTGKKAKLIKN